MEDEEFLSKSTIGELIDDAQKNILMNLKKINLSIILFQLLH